MIQIKNLSKKINKQIILNQINLNFDSTGLIAIIGPSGCGKTTLLNCINGLLDYEGEIFIDGKYLSNLDDKEMSNYRLNNIGFIFQDFKLFSSETVEENIAFPIKTKTSQNKQKTNNKVEDILALIGLKDRKKEKIGLLSGGEKQRIAIGRALVNDPKIILADEPTGSLDMKNSVEIMNILEKISTKSLVLMVTHDKDLAKKYADRIIEMKDGVIIKDLYVNKHKKEYFLPLCKNPFITDKPSLKIRFLFNHYRNNIKVKKVRAAICNLITSLGLIGIGLSITLSETISSSIKQSYSGLIDENKIVITSKQDDKSSYIRVGFDKENAIKIKNSFKDYILDIGSTYNVDFENYFIDNNTVSISAHNYRTIINELNIRHINDFSWLDSEKVETYPKKINVLNNDEIVLGLNYKLITDICYALKIPRTLESLSLYLLDHKIPICFEVENKNWSYSDSQIFNIVGFVLTKEIKIFHTNHGWNEHIFEERMKFPSQLKPVLESDPPWTFQKIYYFHTKNDASEFLSEALNSELLDDGLLEIANENYFPYLYHNVSKRNIKRVLYFKNTYNNIPYRFNSFFKEVSKIDSEPVFSNNYTYCIYPSSLLYGFNKYMLFASNEEDLKDAINGYSIQNINGMNQIELKDNVAIGHYSKNYKSSVIFKSINNKNLKIDEVAISKALAKKIFGSENVAIDKQIYISCGVNEHIKNNQIYLNFEEEVLTVKNVIDSNKLVIYQNPTWTNIYFQSRFGFSCFDLINYSVSYDCGSKDENCISRLKHKFPQYEIINPLNDINQGIGKVCFYIQIALFFFSLITLFSSILLITVCNYLYVMENAKDIALARCIGVNKKEASKFIFFNSLLTCLTAFLLASIELIIITIVLSSEINGALLINKNAYLNPFSFLAMLIIGLIISLFSSIFIAKDVKKIKPLEILKKSSI